MTKASLAPLNLSDRAEKEEENADIGSERKGEHDRREGLNIREHKHLAHNLQKRCEGRSEHDIRKTCPDGKAFFFLTFLGTLLFRAFPFFLEGCAFADAGFCLMTSPSHLPRPNCMPHTMKNTHSATSTANMIMPTKSISPSFPSFQAHAAPFVASNAPS